MLLKFKIFLKILRFEIGLRGLVFLAISILLFSVGKNVTEFYLSSILPAIIITGFLFDFKINNSAFVTQYLYLTKSIIYIKIFSLLWAQIYSIYILSLYFLFYNQISFEILFVISQVSFFCYFAASYILLRHSLLIVYGLVSIAAITFFNMEISLLLNSGILLLSFYPFNYGRLNSSKSDSKHYTKNLSSSNFDKYNIDHSNYIIKFLLLTINRNDMHKVVIKSIFFIIIIFTFFIITTVYQDIDLSNFSFFIFMLQLLLILITTYCLILCKKIRYQHQFKESYKDIYIQLSKIYFILFYFIIIIIILCITTNGKVMINSVLAYTFISLSLFAHFSFSFLFSSNNYVIYFFIIFILGVISSILPGVYKFLFTLAIFCLNFIFLHKKIVKVDYANS